MSWETNWLEHHTPWDAGDASPTLKELVKSGTLPEGRALVPGCGSGYDVFELASEKRRAIGLEVAPTAKKIFEAKRLERNLPSEQASVIVHDFFSFHSESPFDLIWDYTFLCAIQPEQRQAWAKKMKELLSPKGELITLLFPVTSGPKDQGPPFPLDPELIKTLLSSYFQVSLLEPVEHSHPARVGKEWLGRWTPKTTR
ncbi:MAG: methyltransferase domain-containing protein [Myxococcales bacterium]|nr:MAG: methyltransferase domain-containing protein [Myxococcales bacterium]